VPYFRVKNRARIVVRDMPCFWKQGSLAPIAAGFEKVLLDRTVDQIQEGMDFQFAHDNRAVHVYVTEQTDCF